MLIVDSQLPFKDSLFCFPNGFTFLNLFITLKIWMALVEYILPTKQASKQANKQTKTSTSKLQGDQTLNIIDNKLLSTLSAWPTSTSITL